MKSEEAIAASHETANDRFNGIIADINQVTPGMELAIEKEGGPRSMLQVINDVNRQPSQPTAKHVYAFKNLRDYGIAEEKAEIYANRLDSVLLLFPTISDFVLELLDVS